MIRVATTLLWLGVVSHAFLPPPASSIIRPAARRVSTTSTSSYNKLFLSAPATTYGSSYYSIDIDENAYRDIPALEEWAANCGVQRHQGFQLVPTTSTMASSSTDDDSSEDYLQLVYSKDVSVITTEPIPAGTNVLVVPKEMILSAQAIMQEFGIAEAAEKILAGMPSPQKKELFCTFYLMAKILVEVEAGTASPYFPWLNSLPRFFSNGASMTPLCFECLPPLVSSLAMEERTNCRSLSANAVDKFPFLSQETRNNKELCQWAFQIASTRSFRAVVGDNTEDEDYYDLRIVPMCDMFNHGSSSSDNSDGSDGESTDIAIQYDGEGNCYAQATRDIPAGSPLRTLYGDPTNPSFLLARYGFVDETAPATFCKLMIPHVDAMLQDMGYAPHRMLFYKDTGEVSPEVFDVILYQILASNNAKQRRDFYRAHMNSDEETKTAFHQHYWPETSAKLLHHIDSFVQDLDKLAAKTTRTNNDIQQHPRLPLIWKHNDFVRKTFALVRARYFE